MSVNQHLRQPASRLYLQPAFRPTLTLGVLLMYVVFTPATVNSQPADVDALRQHSLELVNEARSEQDLPPLELEARLNRSADAHAQDMLEQDYFSHVSPEGEDVMDRYLAAGGSLWRLVQENIGHCAGCAPPSEDDIVRQHENWMQSPEHRANILAEGLSQYGLGLAAGEDEVYFVQNFLGPGLPRGLAEGEDPEPLPPEELAAFAAELVNEHRRTENIPDITVSDPLVEGAYALTPEDMAAFSLDEIGNPAEAVPDSATPAWRRLSVIASACGGCGVEPTDADVRYFVREWLDNPDYRDQLLDPQSGALGLAVRADGEGRKVGVALLGGQ